MLTLNRARDVPRDVRANILIKANLDGPEDGKRWKEEQAQG
jgi:hypothetical protein